MFCSIALLLSSNDAVPSLFSWIVCPSTGFSCSAKNLALVVSFSAITPLASAKLRSSPYIACAWVISAIPEAMFSACCSLSVFRASACSSNAFFVSFSALVSSSSCKTTATMAAVRAPMPSVTAPNGDEIKVRAEPNNRDAAAAAVCAAEWARVAAVDADVAAASAVKAATLARIHFATLCRILSPLVAAMYPPTKGMRICSLSPMNPNALTNTGMMVFAIFTKSSTSFPNRVPMLCKALFSAPPEKALVISLTADMAYLTASFSGSLMPS